MSPTPARRIWASTPGPSVTASSRAAVQPSRCFATSSPARIPATVRLSGSASSQTARGVAAASSGTAHFSSSAWVAASAPPRAPKYRAACARSMFSGFSSRSGILGPMLICPPSFTRIKNRLSIQHPRFPVNAKHRIYFGLQSIAFASNLRYTVKKECDRYG